MRGMKRNCKRGAPNLQRSPRARDETTDNTYDIGASGALQRSPRVRDETLFQARVVTDPIRLQRSPLRGMRPEAPLPCRTYRRIFNVARMRGMKRKPIRRRFDSTSFNVAR